MGLGFGNIGKHNHKKGTIPGTYTGGSNSSSAWVFDGADLMSRMVSGIGISGDFSVLTSSEAGSLR